MSRWVVFTDLDGTLLDSATFDFEAALPAIERLRRGGIPLVPVTSKTFDEVETLAGELGLSDVLIVESGGGIARREGASWSLEPLGPAIQSLREAIPEIERRAPAVIARYSSMSVEEASERSGLSGDALERSRRRRFSEPFVLRQGQAEDVVRAAGELGLAVRRGGRFLHLGGTAGKGVAVAIVAARFGADVKIVALGDAPMDAEFLALAHVAVVLPRRDGTPDAQLLASVPGARIAPAPPPAGWARAIEAIVEEIGDSDAA